jgi:hypothetical protein
MRSMARTLTVLGSLALGATTLVTLYGSATSAGETLPNAAPDSHASLESFETPNTKRSIPAGSTLARLVSTADEMLGAKVYVGDELATLRDLTWGIDHDGHVQLASVVFEMQSGAIHALPSPVPFVKLTRRVEDLYGHVFGFEGLEKDMRVQEIQYAIDLEGRLVVAYLECRAADGRDMVVDTLLGFSCCHSGTVWSCSGSACPIPTVCGGTPPNCLCGGGGACGSQLLIGCRGGCPGTESYCTGTACTNDPTHCRCY